jgi:hypothetical protein
VEFSGPERLQDKEIERTLQEIRLFGTQLHSPIE